MRMAILHGSASRSLQEIFDKTFEGGILCRSILALSTGNLGQETVNTMI